MLDARATPPHDTPPAQGDQLLDAPRESEHHSQLTQLPTHRSTSSSSAPTATAVPTTPISIPQSGMSPSLTFPWGGSSGSGEVAQVDIATPVEIIEMKLAKVDLATEVIEILDDAPTGTAVPTTSIGIPGWGMPPSLSFPGEGSSRFGEVVKTDQATPVEVIEILDEDEEKGEERPRAIRWWDVTQSRGTQG